MSVSFKTDGVEISALRDRAMFNTFAGNTSYVIKDIGDELSVTYSSNSFVVELGTGEAVICGGSMLSEGTADAITLGENENGYLVVEVDLSQSGNNICKFKNVPVLTQENINGVEGYVYDLPLYQYSTTTNGVQNMVDVRLIKSSSIGEIYFTTEGNDVYAVFKNGDQEVKKELGSLNPATLTATPADVLSGKLFGGSGSDEPQTGTMPSRALNTYASAVGKDGTSVYCYMPYGYWQEYSGKPGQSYVRMTNAQVGTATQAQVLKNKTFTSSAGANLAGTMNDYSVTTETTRKTFTPSTSAQSYTIPTGYYSGSNVVKCNAISTQTKTATPSTSSQTITPDSGKYLSSVTVNAIPNAVYKQEWNSTTTNSFVITINNAITHGYLCISAYKEGTGAIEIAAAKNSGTITLSLVRQKYGNYASSARGALAVYRVTGVAAGAKVTITAGSGQQVGMSVILIGW